MTEQKGERPRRTTRFRGSDGHAPVRQPLLMTPREAANALRISPRKLWQITDEGQLPCVRIGRCRRYCIADLEAWIADQRECQKAPQHDVLGRPGEHA